MQRVCGINDRNIPYLELLLNGEVFAHGNSVTYRGSAEDNRELFKALLMRLKEIAEERDDITEPEIFMEYQALLNGQPIEEGPHTTIQVGGRTVYPKSPNQRTFIELMNKRQVVFSIGPAGTGKTFLAVAYALSEVLKGAKQKIVLTRPVIEAGENLGFLPGDLTQKINPYLRPLYDAMEYLLPPAIIRRLENTGGVEIAPLAYMRGRSLSNAAIILDEAQNTTREQMKMFLTRLSENSCAFITGDITQIDLPKPHLSGLIHATQILREIEEIGFVEFSSVDVVRSRMVQRIINAYEKDIR